MVDIEVPDEDVLTDAVAWIADRLADGRTVLVHCARGRGRSATVRVAHLVAAEGMGVDEVAALLTSKRSLGKVQGRHRHVLEPWIANRRTTAVEA